MSAIEEISEKISDKAFCARVRLVSVVYSILSADIILRLRELEPEFRHALESARELSMDVSCALLRAISDTYDVINYHGYEEQGCLEPCRKRGSHLDHEHIPVASLPTFPCNRCNHMELQEFLNQFDPMMEISHQTISLPIDDSELDRLFECCPACSNSMMDRLPDSKSVASRRAA